MLCGDRQQQEQQEQEQQPKAKQQPKQQQRFLTNYRCMNLLFLVVVIMVLRVVPLSLLSRNVVATTTTTTPGSQHYHHGHYGRPLLLLAFQQQPKHQQLRRPRRQQQQQQQQQTTVVSFQSRPILAKKPLNFLQYKSQHQQQQARTHALSSSFLLLSSSSSTTSFGFRGTTTTTTRLYATSNNSTTTTTTTTTESDLSVRIQAKGDEIRALKEGGADKAAVAPLVQELLALKEQLQQEQQGEDYNKNKKQQQNKNKNTMQNEKKKKKKKDDNEKNDNDKTYTSYSDYITARHVDYSKWYNDIIRVTGLAESSPVRGCMVIKPWGMSIWDKVRTILNDEIQAQNVQNAYFPLLIPQSFLSKEAEHVDGFAKECAVVTHHRLTTRTTINPTTSTSSTSELIPDPEAELEEPLIIRPTSETMIWYMFRKWITSYRDLPLKINQWANVMRWELRTRPFLRTSEFLWQEGHTAHATKQQAEKQAQTMIQVYANVCRTVLAIPVVIGMKSPMERFAGAQETYTIETLMPNGWALQSGTSHFLGQSFGTAFNVTFQDETGTEQIVWGTSWGVSTRLLGALIMTHSDDAGLVLPPTVAPIQIVIVPIQPKKTNSNYDSMKTKMESTIQDIQNKIKQENPNIRIHVDDRDYIRIGVKYFEWERKGVPLRIEIGPRDMELNQVVFKYRAPKYLAKNKQIVNITNVGRIASQGLDTMQQELYKQAKEQLQNGIQQSKPKRRQRQEQEQQQSSSSSTDDASSSRKNDDHNVVVEEEDDNDEDEDHYDYDYDEITYDTVKKALENNVASQYTEEGDNQEGPLFLVPWKCNSTNEAQIKQDCQATIRCYPLEDNPHLVVIPMDDDNDNNNNNKDKNDNNKDENDKTRSNKLSKKKNPLKGRRCFYSGEPATHMALFGRAF